ncbi:MAG: hypothetical protein AAF392_00015 [Bacteroidota bacterium]
MKQHIIIKNIFRSVLTTILWIVLASSIQAKSTRTINIKLTFQEVQIMRQIMQQIELGTQEVEPYLEIYTLLEELTASEKEPTQELLLRLPERAPENLLLFMQRATILGVGAKQIDMILKKIEKSLPKDTPLADTPKV